MIGNNEVPYLRQRILEERELAITAACEESRAAHATTAKRYEARLTMSYLHEANAIRHLERGRPAPTEQSGFTDALKKKRLSAAASQGHLQENTKT